MLSYNPDLNQVENLWKDLNIDVLRVSSSNPTEFKEFFQKKNGVEIHKATKEKPQMI